MTPDRFRRLKQVFDDVCDLPPADRGPALDTLCGNDTDLRTEVEAMLAADERTRTSTGEGAAILSAHLGDDEQATAMPDHIGPYKVLERIGEGGMGTVYLAEQAHPRRRIAVKTLHPGMASTLTRGWFRAEAQALAQVGHAGVPQVFDAAATDQTPYVAMELVEGVSLTAFARGLDVRERVALMTAVCDAVHHVHQRGIVHRDLKPANVLVTAEGQPKVLDFGIVQAVALAEGTQVAGRVGTPMYMSPEQLAGAEVDARTDVYALGVCLYQVISARSPYEVSGMTLEQVTACKARQEPAPLREAPWELAAVVSRAMAYDAGARYPSAEALRRDLDRYLSGLPVEAVPPTAAYRWGKALRRHRREVAWFALALAIGVAVALALR